MHCAVFFSSWWQQAFCEFDAVFASISSESVMDGAACSSATEVTAAAVVAIIFLCIFTLLIAADGILSFFAFRGCILADRAPDGAETSTTGGLTARGVTSIDSALNQRVLLRDIRLGRNHA